MAADLTKLKQVRNRHRTHAIKLFDKSKKDSQIQLQDVKILLSSLIKKQQILERCDENILELLTEEVTINEEIENSSVFADRMIEATTRLEITVDYINRKMAEETKPIIPDTKPIHVVEPVATSKKSESQVKLPKITIKVYDGSLLTWINFWGLFEAAVHNNSELSDIQKFTYLKSFLSGEAERAIVGYGSQRKL